MRNLRQLFAVSLGLIMLAQPFAAFARTTNDTSLAEQWYLNTISAPAAWDTQTGSKNVVVAVLDTGVDITHPDLTENIWLNPHEIMGNSRDDDGNGYLDDLHGWDFVDDDAEVSPDQDGNQMATSHGTLIAGLIAAEGNNGTGIAGIAWHASIMSVRMLDANGTANSAIAADAVDYAVANGADIINLSFSGTNADTVLRTAISRAYQAGVVVVSAMGNDAADTDIVPVYPACLGDSTHDWVIGVASTSELDNPSSFSNYGHDCTDISAPGENIYGLSYHNPTAGYDLLYDGGWNGTSTASPIIAGAAALILSAFPDLTVDQVRNTLKLSVDPLHLSVEQRGKFGSGRVNLAQALAIAAQFSNNTGLDPTLPYSSSTEPTTNYQLPTLPSSTPHLAFGNTSTLQPMVSILSPNGVTIANFAAYASTYLGGIKVALGNVTGNGTDSVVTGTGLGGGPQVRVFTTAGALISQFFAYDESSRQGVNVTTGDLDGDGTAEIITSVGSGVSSEIVAYSYRGVEKLRFTASQFPASASLNIAVGDLDADGLGEFIVAAGVGNAAQVALFDDDGSFLREFAPYATSFTGGVFVAAGDINGDGTAEIVTGTGDGGGPQIRIFNALGSVVNSFFAFSSTSRHGVRIAVADTDRDGTAEVIASPGPTMTTVKIMTANGSELSSFELPPGGHEGIAVAAW
jgi:subtilisin family serine protease